MQRAYRDIDYDHMKKLVADISLETKNLENPDCILDQWQSK